MKIKSLDIIGMHNVKQKRYDFDDVNYIFGPNGAGKSTILQAIQLALLGYIPGTNKTNSAIMEHSNGNEMTIIVEFDTGDVVKRTWTKKGSKIDASVNSSLELEELLGNGELPVFDFNEFISMTANKTKDWFIGFLPSPECEIDWREQIEEWSRDMKLSDEFMAELVEGIEGIESDNAIDKIRLVNEYLKEKLSAAKSKLSYTEGSINTLIRYDESDIPLDEESLRKMKSDIDFELSDIDVKKNKIIEAQTARRNVEMENARIDASIKEIESKLGLDVKAEEEKLSADLANIEQMESDIAKLREDYSETAKAINDKKYKERCEELRLSLSEEQRILDSRGMCPYTNTNCQTIASRMSSAQNRVKSLSDELSSTTEAMHKSKQELESIRDAGTALGEKLAAAKASYDAKRKQLDDYIASIESDKERVEKLKNSYVEVAQDFGEFDMSEEEMREIIEELETKVQENRSKLEKIESNIKYNNVIDGLVSDRLEIENNIEALKRFVKNTGENGMQTDIMQEPFFEMEKAMDKHVKHVFKDDVSCKFNVTNKANSFSFGIVRDGSYIPYTLLSSGEKTLFVFSLLLYIAVNSNSDLHLLLIDDMLDHLDDDKVVRFFEIMSSIDEAQLIMAGVQRCDNDNVNVIEVTR